MDENVREYETGKGVVKVVYIGGENKKIIHDHLEEEIKISAFFGDEVDVSGLKE